MVFVSRPRGGRYRFLTIVPPWGDPPYILPYYGAIVLVIAGMGSILALHIAAPLRRLRTVVEQFGHGDLSARVRSRRKDEIGELSQSFDEMAGRIETLLSAERRLLQDVSHELRSPLARLGFAVELAGHEEERDEALARVRKEADRMTALVGELLQLTRIEGDPSSARKQDIALDSLVAEVQRDCNVEAQARGCAIMVDSVPGTVVSGEQELLRRALENVVRNAIRHAPGGSPIEVHVHQAGDRVVLTVRDHGPGVPEQLLGTIFKPFFRVEDDRSRASGGVGLGLAIARRAVEVHQGSITARNAGPGLIITIELPFARGIAEGSPGEPGTSR
jgi:two-component system sensor histidine kinase CpxA